MGVGWVFVNSISPLKETFLQSTRQGQVNSGVITSDAWYQSPYTLVQLAKDSGFTVQS